MNLMQKEIIPLDTGNLPFGVIHASNETRFDSSHLSEPLTTFATGVIDRENLGEVLNLIAPRIVAPRRFEYRTASSSEDFLSETDDVREIGASFKRIETRGDTVNAKTQNKGLTIRLDRDGEGALPGAAERAAGRLTRRLFRNDLRRAVALVVASAATTAKTWNTSADPDTQLLDLVEASGDKRGINPNVILMGTAAWVKRIASLSGNDKAGAMAKILWTPEQLASWLGIDRIIKPSARYQVTAAAKSKIVGSYAIAYYAEQDAGLDSPTNMARFVTPTDAGDVRVYVEEFPKYIDVSVEHYSLVAAPSTLGIDGLTIS
jgi:hypothetical protein